MKSFSKRPFIIVAPNGAYRSTSDHPAIPLTPAELAQTALECLHSGAAMIHLHARTPEGHHSLELDDNRRTYEAVKEAVGDRMVVQMTTESASQYSIQAQMDLIYDLQPEAASFGLRELIPDPSYEAHAGGFFRWVAETGILAQYILYSPEDLRYYLDLRKRNLLPTGNHHLLIVLGRYSEGMRSNTRHLTPFKPLLWQLNDVRWAVCAFGELEQACLLSAVELGGDVRVGFENNLYDAQGDLARDNASQVRQLYRAICASQILPLSGEDVRRRMLTAANERARLAHY